MNKNNWTQAYKIVPWRGQLQWLGIMAAALLIIILIASIYLSISSQAGIAGRGLQVQQREKSDTIESIAQLETDLARVTSSTEMRQRAKKLGFEPVAPQDFTYIIVPGYAGRPSADLSPHTADMVPPSVIKTAYTQSIWDWMYSSFVQPAYGE